MALVFFFYFLRIVSLRKNITCPAWQREIMHGLLSFAPDPKRHSEDCLALLQGRVYGCVLTASSLPPA